MWGEDREIRGTRKVTDERAAPYRHGGPGDLRVRNGQQHDVGAVAFVTAAERAMGLDPGDGQRRREQPAESPGADYVDAGTVKGWREEG